MKLVIFPSVMAKNQQELDLLLQKLKGTAKTLHLDLADGKCVPNTSLNFRFTLNKNFSYNAHLMTKNPEEWIRKNKYKFNLIIPQFEEVNNIKKYISESKKRKVAFALNPETKIEKIRPYLKDIDYILILTVHPGFYGAKFLEEPLLKIKQIKKINPSIKVIVDGGMDLKTIKLAKNAGADYFVSGSFVSKAENPKKAMKALQEAIQ